uniref:Uncharacterized protein n=1 Tax=Melopsittacus undulatus TaxID=13146 RepID=A0A8V5GQW5_MELUD
MGTGANGNGSQWGANGIQWGSNGNGSQWEREPMGSQWEREPMGIQWEWEPMGTGALALARFLEREHFDFRGLSVIELGAGTGILGILAAMLVPPSHSHPLQSLPVPPLTPPPPGADVTITDLPEALAQIRTNVRLNFPCPRSRPRVRRLRWGQDESSFPGDGHLLLGSDLVYDRSSSAALLAALRSLCGPRSRALLSARSRGGEGGSRSFFRRVLPRFFRVQLVGQEEENEIEIYGEAEKDIEIYGAINY